MTMLADMQDAGLRPNDRTFSTLMRGCMRDARGDAAQAVLTHMQRTGIALDGACLEYGSSSLPSVYFCNIWSGTQSKLLCMTAS